MSILIVLLPVALVAFIIAVFYGCIKFLLFLLEKINPTGEISDGAPMRTIIHSDGSVTTYEDFSLVE